MKPVFFPFVVVIALCTSALVAQQTPLKVALSTAFIPGIQATGNVTWTYGSDQQTGTVTLQASANGQSQIQLTLPAGTWTETQSTATGFEGNCTWTGFDGVVHSRQSFNCWRGTVWFLPQITSQAGPGWADNVCTFASSTAGGGTFHCERHPQGKMSAKTALLLAKISAYDLKVDSLGQPQALVFNDHPDNDSTVDIPTEIDFADYRPASGALIPFHIQKFINHGLVLDLQITNVQISASLPSGS